MTEAGKARRRPHLLIAALLAVAVLMVYWNVLNSGFINFDDDVYVLINPHVNPD